MFPNPFRPGVLLPLALTGLLFRSKGRAWFLLKATSTGRLARQALSVEGREAENAQQIKKKIMKTKNTNSNSELKNRTAQLIETKTELPKLNLAKRIRNRSLPTDRVLKLLQKEAPRFWELAEVVGKWVWIQFEDKQPSEITVILSQLGFHWNNRRQVWQHPCGQIMSRGNYDPRRRYGSYFPADQKAA
jgi:hypothetical protein